MGIPLQARPAPAGTVADARQSIVDSFRYLENRTGRIRTFAMAHGPGTLAGGGA